MFLPLLPARDAQDSADAVMVEGIEMFEVSAQRIPTFWYVPKRFMMPLVPLVMFPSPISYIHTIPVTLALALASFLGTFLVNVPKCSLRFVIFLPLVPSPYSPTPIGFPFLLSLLLFVPFLKHS